MFVIYVHTHISSHSLPQQHLSIPPPTSHPRCGIHGSAQAELLRIGHVEVSSEVSQCHGALAPVEGLEETGQVMTSINRVITCLTMVIMDIAIILISISRGYNIIYDIIPSS